MIMNRFYEQFDKVYSAIEKLLNHYGKSAILQNHFMSIFESFFYATLIDNFFINLNRENVKEFNLPWGKIGRIKREYKDLRRDIRSALSLSLKDKKIDGEFYDEFKMGIERDFLGFQKITEEIEKKIDLEKAKEYLAMKTKEIKKLGKPDKDLDVLFMTKVLEYYVQREKCIPIDKKVGKFMEALAREIVPTLSQHIMKTLKKYSKEMLDYQRKLQTKFESRIYKDWEEPLDLLECLIEVSFESGEKQREKLSRIADSNGSFKTEALIQIHTRALQISKEILVLLKAGYADGANSRWRSLHELAVISFFLSDNSDDVSKRYLDHEVVRRFKEAKDYRAHYRELGYLPISRKDFNRIKEEKERLCKKYGDDFRKLHYGWIPSSILPNRNFRALEASVELSRFRPFYNLSCDSVHGGAKGFYRLGLMPESQDKILLAGPSNYGLADPMQNTAISLSHITVCLLRLKSDLENIIQMQILISYINEICAKAVEVQKSIENEVRESVS